MGNVYIKIPIVAKDGVPENSVSWIKMNYQENGTKYPIADDERESQMFGDRKDSNPGKVIVNASRVVINHNGGSGLEVEIILIEDPLDVNKGRPSSIRVKMGKNGTSYTTLPTIELDNDTLDCTVHLGDGLLSHDDYNNVLIYQNGAEKNKEGLFFKINPNTDRFVDAAKGKAVDDFSNLMKPGGTWGDVRQFSVFNPYNRLIDNSDAMGFVTNVASTWSSFKALAAINDMEQSVIEANRRIDTELNPAINKLNIAAKEKYWDDVEASKLVSINNWETELGNWQTAGFNKDLFNYSYTSFQEATTEISAIYTAIIKNISPYLRIIGMFDPTTLESMSFTRNMGAIQAMENLVGGFPTYQPPQLGDEPTDMPLMGHMSMPPNLGTYKGIANIFIFKAVCFAGLAALAHLYEALTAGRKGGEYFGSPWRITASPNIISFNQKDGAIMSYIKTSCRQHDVIGQVKNLFSSIYAVLKGLLATVTGESENANKIRAFYYACAVGVLVENMKSMHDLLGRWVDVYCNNKDKFSGNENMIAYFQWCEVVQGAIAIKLDEIAYLYQTNGSKFAGGTALPHVFPLSFLVANPGKNGTVSVAYEVTEVLKDSSSRLWVGKNEAMSNGTIDSNGRGSISHAYGTDFIRVYGNRCAKAPCVVQLEFKDAGNTSAQGGELKGATVLEKGKGFYFAPVVRVDPRAYLTQNNSGEVLDHGVNHVVVEVPQKSKERYKRHELNDDEGNGLKGQELTRAMEALSKEEVNKAINEGNGSEQLAKWSTIFRTFGGSGGSDVISRLLTTENPYELGDDSGFGRLTESAAIGKFYHSLSILGTGFPNKLWYSGGRSNGNLNSKKDIIRPPGGLSSMRMEIFKKFEPKKKIGNVAHPPKTTHDPNLVDLSRFDYFYMEPGLCDKVEIKRLNDKLATRFFNNTSAYLKTVQGQKVREALCQRRACGVVHAYSSVPSVGEPDIDFTDFTPDGNLCGNVSVTWNFHPTLEYASTAEWEYNPIEGFFGSDSNLTDQLKIQNVVRYGFADAPSLPVGSLGDVSLPMVFGNYALAFKHGQWTQNGKGFLWWKSILSTTLSALANVTAGALKFSHVEDPTIDKSKSAYTQKLLKNYNELRLHHESLGTVAGNSKTYADTAPSRKAGDFVINGDGGWNRTDASNYLEIHGADLKNAYATVAQRTGIYAWNSGFEGAQQIKPILSVTRKMSGMCWPIISDYGVGKASWLWASPEGMLLDGWELSANHYKKKQEISIGILEGGEGTDSLVFGSNNTEVTQSRTRKSEKEYKKDTWITEGAHWRPVLGELTAELEKISNVLPVLNVEDISYRADIRGSGFAAGAGKMSILDTDGDQLTEAQLEKTGINIKKYKAQAASEDWDSNDAKEKSRIPHWANGALRGASMISGELKETASEAWASASSEYDDYRKYANSYHYSGQGTLFTGAIVESEDIYEKTGYHATDSGLAGQSGFNQLAALPTGQFDEANPLSVSGVKSRDNTTTTFNGCTSDPVWSPIEPSKTYTSVGERHYTGIGYPESAAIQNFQTLRSGAPFANCGTIWGATGKHALASTESSWHSFGASSGIARTLALNSYNTYSVEQHGLFGTGMGPTVTGWATITESSISGGTNCATGAAYLVDDWWSDNGTNLLYAQHLLYSGYKDCSCLSELICFNMQDYCSGGYESSEATSCDFQFGEAANDLTKADGFWSGMSVFRNKTYQFIRARLVNGDNISGTAAYPIGAESEANRYDFAAIDDSLRVYPNTGVMAATETDFTGINFWTSEGATLLGLHQSGVTTHSQLSGQLTGNAGGTFTNLLNLKDFTASTGDKDIYIMERYIWDYQNTSCENENSGTIYHTKQISNYDWLTSVFKPTDMNNRSGNYYPNSSLCSGYSHTITATAQPTVVTGSGVIPMWNSGEIKKVVVTGRMDTHMSRAWIPIMRNTYNGRVIASGYVPVITGKADWSSRRRQMWDTGDASVVSSDTEWTNSAIDLPSPTGIQMASEKYYVGYPKGYSGIFSDLGYKSGELKRVKDAWQQNNAGKTFEADEYARIKDRAVDGVVAEVSTNGKFKAVLLGGWPIANQSHKGGQNALMKSVFGKKYILYDANKYKGKFERYIQSNRRQWILSLFGAGAAELRALKGDIDNVVKVYGSRQKFEGAAADAKRYANIENFHSHVVKISHVGNDQIQITSQSAGKDGLKMKIVGQHTAPPEEHQEFVYLVASFEMMATACSSCIGSPIDTSTTTDSAGINHKVTDPVFFMGENYMHGIQVDWELRSGGWNFTVPYTHPGVTVTWDGGAGIEKGTQVLTQNWWEYVETSFMNSQDKKYSGHWTAFDVIQKNSQLQCPTTEKTSKLDKITDFNVFFKPKEGSYKYLSDKGSKGHNLNLGAGK